MRHRDLFEYEYEYRCTEYEYDLSDVHDSESPGSFVTTVETLSEALHAAKPFMRSRCESTYGLQQPPLFSGAIQKMQVANRNASATSIPQSKSRKGCRSRLVCYSKPQRGEGMSVYVNTS